MEAEWYYYKLRERHASVPEGTAFELPMDQVCEALACTRRNAQLQLASMQERGLLTWEPGRGRGNRSRLTFRASLREPMLDKARRLASAGKLAEARRLLEPLGDDALNFAFGEWLSGQFGLHRPDAGRDVLRFPFYRPVPALDPAMVMRRTEAHWVAQIFDTLCAYDPDRGGLRPALAHAWERDGQARRWRLYLRKGVRFHHGKLLTAEDAAFTFRRILRLNGEDFVLRDLQEIRVLDDYSLELRFGRPAALLMHALCLERYSVVPSDLNEETFARLPVGTGAFRVTGNDESMLALEAHDRYFLGRPHLDRIEMWVWTDYDGILEHAEKLAGSQLLYLETGIGSEGEKALSRLEAGSTYAAFNLNKAGPMQDPIFREAVDAALDRQAMVEELGGVRGMPSGSFFPEGSATGDSNQHAMDSDPAARSGKAEGLLRRSSYRGETLRLFTYAMPDNERNAAWIRDRCGEIGIVLEIVSIPIEQLSDPAVLAEADLVVAGEVLGEQPDLTLIEMYRMTRSFIPNLLSPSLRAENEKAMDACMSEISAERRIAQLRSWERRLSSERFLLFLFHSKHTASLDRRLGVNALNAWGKVSYKDAWVKPAKAEDWPHG